MGSLEEFALRGLVRCYDPEARLFRAKLVQTAEGIHTVGQSFRYSGMVAIGLNAAAQRGLTEARASPGNAPRPARRDRPPRDRWARPGPGAVGPRRRGHAARVRAL